MGNLFTSDHRQQQPPAQAPNNATSSTNQAAAQPTSVISSILSTFLPPPPPPKLDPSKCFIHSFSGESFTGNTLKGRVGDQQFLLTLVNEKGDVHIDDVKMSEISVLVTGDADYYPLVAETSSKNIYSVNFFVKRAGKYTVHVKVMQKPIQRNPFTMMLSSEDLDPTQVRLADDIFVLPIFATGQMIKCMVTTKDKYGNVCSKGGHSEKFSVMVNGAKHSPDFMSFCEDLKNGQYELVLSFLQSGIFRVQFFYEQQNLVFPKPSLPIGDQYVKFCILSPEQFTQFDKIRHTRGHLEIQKVQIVDAKKKTEASFVMSLADGSMHFNTPYLYFFTKTIHSFNLRNIKILPQFSNQNVFAIEDRRLNQAHVMVSTPLRQIIYALHKSFCSTPMNRKELENMVDRFFTKFSFEADAEAAKMYKIAKHFKGQDYFLDKWKQHVLYFGKKLINDILMNASSAEEKEKSFKLYTDYVDDMISYHDKISKCCYVNFDNDKVMASAMRDALSNVLNIEIEYKPKNIKASSLQLICQYIDDLLRNPATSGSNSTDLDFKMESIVGLCHSIQDKDILQESYRRQLARRLLLQSSSRDVTNLIFDERTMLSKFKSAFGLSFTSKMEGMIKDFIVSQDLMPEFAKYIVKSKKGKLEEATEAAVDGVRFEVQVLTLGYWPTFVSYDKLVLPTEMQSCVDKFVEFYKVQTSGRKLVWAYSQGTVTITARYPSGEYTLQVPIPTAAILLLFNNMPQLTVEQIEAIVKLRKEEVVSVIQRLTTSSKILKMGSSEQLSAPSTENEASTTIAPPSASSSSESSSSYISINDDFKSQKRKIVMVAKGAEVNLSETEKKTTDSTILASRNIIAEAAIVRLMKMRKQMTHSTLMAEVTKQLLPFFKPDVRFLKTRIESLIQREFIERDENTGLFAYVA